MLKGTGTPSATAKKNKTKKKNKRKKREQIKKIEEHIRGQMKKNETKREKGFFWSPEDGEVQLPKSMEKIKGIVGEIVQDAMEGIDKIEKRKKRGEIFDKATKRQCELYCDLCDQVKGEGEGEESISLYKNLMWRDRDYHFFSTNFDGKVKMFEGRKIDEAVSWSQKETGHQETDLIKCVVTESDRLFALLASRSHSQVLLYEILTIPLGETQEGERLTPRLISKFKVPAPLETVAKHQILKVRLFAEREKLYIFAENGDGTIFFFLANEATNTTLEVANANETVETPLYQVANPFVHQKKILVEQLLIKNYERQVENKIFIKNSLPHILFFSPQSSNIYLTIFPPATANQKPKSANVATVNDANAASASTPRNLKAIKNPANLPTEKAEKKGDKGREGEVGEMGEKLGSYVCLVLQDEEYARALCVDKDCENFAVGTNKGSLYVKRLETSNFDIANLINFSGVSIISIKFIFGQFLISFANGLQFIFDAKTKKCEQMKSSQHVSSNFPVKIWALKDGKYAVLFFDGNLRTFNIRERSQSAKFNDSIETALRAPFEMPSPFLLIKKSPSAPPPTQSPKKGEKETSAEVEITYEQFLTINNISSVSPKYFYRKKVTPLASPLSPSNTVSPVDSAESGAYYYIKNSNPHQILRLTF